MYKEEISQPRSWLFRIVVGLFGIYLFTLFLVGGSNALFQTEKWQQKIHQLVVEQIPNTEVSFEPAKITLAGYLPRLSIELENIKAIKFNNNYKFDLQIDHIKARISWRSLLLEGELKVLPVKLGKVVLKVEENNQTESPSKMKTPLIKGAVKRPNNKPVNKLVNNYGNRNEEENKRLFTRLKVDVVDIFWSTDNFKEKISIKDIVSGSFIKDEEFLVTGNFFWDKFEKLDNKVPKLKLSFQIKKNEKEVEHLLELKGRWQEGIITFLADLKKKTFKLDTKQVALSSVVKVLEDRIEESKVSKQILKKVMKNEFGWISCSIKGDLKAESVEVSSCATNGEAGKTKVDNLLLNYKEKKLTVVPPVEVTLEKIDIKKVLDSLSVNIMDGFLNEFGYLNGVLNYDELKNIEIDGEITDVILNFSRKGLRARQHISLIQGRVRLSEERVMGYLEEAKIKKGDFDGKISFNFNKDFKKGIVQLGVERVSFNKQIQKSFFGGDISPMSIYGKFQVSEGIVSHWDGVLGMNLLVTEEEKIEKIKIDSLFKNGLLRLSTEVLKVSLFKDSKIKSWLNPVLKKHMNLKSDESNKGDNPVELKNIKSNIFFKGSTAYWKNTDGFLSSVASGEIKLNSEGFVFTKNKYNGWLKSMQGKKKLHWNILNENNVPSLLLRE